MNTWSSPLASSCWCGASLFLPVCAERLHLGAGTSPTGHLTAMKNFIINKLSMCMLLHAWKSGMCLCVWSVNISWEQSGKGTAVRTAGKSGVDSAFHLNAGIYTLSKAQTHCSLCQDEHAYACDHMHTHKGLFQLHSLHHTFQDISSSFSHFLS